jgi:hypothetical protein
MSTCYNKHFYKCYKFSLYWCCTVVVHSGGVESNSHRGHLLSYCTCPGWLWGWRIFRWNEDWQGKPKHSEKTCPSATLSTTNPTWPDPGLNSGLRGGKPETNRLIYGAACTVVSLFTEESLCQDWVKVLNKKTCLLIRRISYGLVPALQNPCPRMQYSEDRGEGSMILKWILEQYVVWIYSLYYLVGTRHSFSRWWVVTVWNWLLTWKFMEPYLRAPVGSAFSVTLKENYL